MDTEVLIIFSSMDNSAIGHRVRELREAIPLSQRQLEARAELGGGYISLLEGNKLPSTPKPKTLRKIASALGVSYEDLTGISEPAEVSINDPRIQRINIAALRLGEINPSALDLLAPMIQSIVDKAERDYAEELRVRKAGRKQAKDSEQADKEV